jgi:hypothetical protein
MTNPDWIITEDIRDAIQLDQTVYDREREKVGTVDGVDRDTAG